MKRLNDYRMRLTLVGTMAVIILGGGRTKADFTFGEPTNVGPPVNTVYSDSVGCISTDGLMLYFVSDRPGGLGTDDFWVATRATKNDPWGPPVNLGPTVNSSARDQAPCVSSDGLELYFASYRSGNWDMWVARRTTKDADWGTAVNLGPSVNSSAYDHGPWISADGLELYFDSGRPAGNIGDIWVARRATRDDPWGTPVKLGPEINSSFDETGPCISADGRSLFFSDYWNAALRRPGFGGADMYVSRRATAYDPWGPPVNLGPTVNSSAHEEPVRLSPDGSTLYFSSTRPGGYGGQWGDIYEATIIPIVDLNGDGIVDAADMCIMVDHWGENYSLCDIGPTPLGDGIVDIEDMKVLAEHLFEEVSDSTLVAHWPLDEAEGMDVADRAGGNMGYALGDPIWQPDGGQVEGALQLDGVDDYVATGEAPKPEMGAYSVLAWIKGGVPGQVVLSQMGKANWLGTDPSEGFLMTELTVAGRSSCSLGSEAIITDGNWHRIGFVWDGSYRRLYVDGVIAAEDAQDNLDISVNGLYFGTGKTMESSSFFSGLIDDIRIYNRAVTP